MSTCKCSLEVNVDKTFSPASSSLRGVIELTLCSRLTGFVDSSVARVHVDSISARLAEVARKVDKQSRDCHRANRVSAQDDGSESELRRPGASHSQLRSYLVRVQRPKSRPVHHGHSQARNDCR